VTHPFHPLFDQELEFVKRRRNWRADRVYVFGPNGLLLSLPAEWTDVVADVCVNSIWPHDDGLMWPHPDWHDPAPGADDLRLPGRARGWIPLWHHYAGT
jgi:Family of unknown function (DUF5372)